MKNHIHQAANDTMFETRLAFDNVFLFQLRTFSDSSPVALVVVVFCLCWGLSHSGDVPCDGNSLGLKE